MWIRYSRSVKWTRQESENRISTQHLCFCSDWFFPVRTGNSSNKKVAVKPPQTMISVPVVVVWSVIREEIPVHKVGMGAICRSQSIWQNQNNAQFIQKHETYLICSLLKSSVAVDRKRFEYRLHINRLMSYITHLQTSKPSPPITFAQTMSFSIFTE